LTLDNSHQAAVLELAMRASGEIRHLAGIVRPTYAIITNVEPVHLETLGSLENIARAKCELLEYIQPDKFAVINGDNHLLKTIAQSYSVKLYYFGYSAECDIRILSTHLSGNGMEVKLRLFDKDESFYLPVPAPKLASNLASAVGTAYLMGVETELIREGLNNFQTSGNRLKMTDLPEGGTIINDTYNANPVSMAAALEVCCEIAGDRRKVAVLGDMLELGNYEQDGHIQVGRVAADLKMDLLVTVGERAAYIGKGALSAGMSPDTVFCWDDQEKCLAWLKQNVSQLDVVLFKASRGMRLELLAQQWLSGGELVDA
jgi:UDP-N-acetylmuramoyl-tripeptide--D-alanyl-D-alanine ligase